MEKSDVQQVEDLLKARKALELKQEAFKKKTLALTESITDIDQQLLQLAESNLKAWWPGDGKTCDFDHGKLIWRASSGLVTADGEAVTEENTDLLTLANRKGFRDLVKLTPRLEKFKVFIEARKLPKGFEGISVQVVDKFNVKTS